MANWDEIKKIMKEKFSFAAEKTEEYTKIGKVRVEIMTVKKNLDKTFRKLGEENYTLLTKDKKNALLENDSVKELMKEIKSLQATIKEKEKEIENIREESEKTVDVVDAEPVDEAEKK